MTNRPFGLLGLVIAALLVASPAYLFPHAGQSAFRHDLERVERAEIPTEADLLRHANLSAEARSAIRDARTGDGVVYGSVEKPPEFFYSDHASLNRGVYYVERNGSVYRLTTFAGGFAFPFDRLLESGLLLLGLATGLVAIVSLRDGRRWLPALAAVYGGLVLVLAGGVPASGAVVGVPRLWALLLSLAGVVPVLFAFGAIADRSLALRAAGIFGVLVVLTGVVWFLGVFLVGDPPGLPVRPTHTILLALATVTIVAGHVTAVGYHRLDAD